jgi:hypothetical protein
MPRSTRRAVATEPAESGDQLESQLDNLALQIVERANAKNPDGTPVESLQLQLQALKVAGAFYALKKKHTPDEDDTGSAWGGLLMNGAVISRANEDEEDEEEEEDFDG